MSNTTEQHELPSRIIGRFVDLDQATVDDYFLELRGEQLSKLARAVADLESRALAPSSTSAVVLAFARKMEAQLQANMHKGTREEWKTRRKDYYETLVRKADDLLWSKEIGNDVKQCVDLANYALMLADACGGLEEVK